MSISALPFDHICATIFSMESQKIRRRFLNYFHNQGHTVVNSAPVLPHNDPSLLFNNAGMNQFKDIFLGKNTRDDKRAVSSQKCIRVGGKHNDLENVGHTSRHLTFFEMLGNFSFGDYYKKEAIQYAWEVSLNVFELNETKLWATVFDDDDESFELWKAFLPENRIVRMGEKDNFWAMGETGPCGPCSELHYDRGEKYSNARSPLEDPTGERYLEFWNLVFMESNQLNPNERVKLPKPSIDTGAGLERVVGIKMDVDNVFKTDILQALIQQVAIVSNTKYDPTHPTLAPAFHVIADHLRCLSFAIADGAQPSNMDRGYVLRKVLRRAVRYGRTLGMDKPFLGKIFPTLLDTMGEDYPELEIAKERIIDLLTVEEETFIRTLNRGGNILGQIISHSQTHNKIISGDDAFKLKDTYGFPLEEILLIAKDVNLNVDLVKYNILEKEAKERSKKVHKTHKQVAQENLFANFKSVEFIGPQLCEAKGKVTALVLNGELVNEMQEGSEGLVVLDRTPFYAEMGGQVGDKGLLTSESHHFLVKDTKAPFKGITAHFGVLKSGTLHIGDTLDASIDRKRRQHISNNHTATHLLHFALQEVLGQHIKQAGSVVDDKRLRFDFNHHKSVSQEEIYAIEDLINEKIRLNLAVNQYQLTYEEVQKRSDIKQFFGDKYGKTVTVVDIDFSKELCGGTHTSHTGNIGLVKIVKESSIAAGVRRIEAVTGLEAEHLVRQSELEMQHLANLLKSRPKQVIEKVEKLLQDQNKILQEIKALKKDQIEQQVTELLKEIKIVKAIPVLALEVHVPQGEIAIFADTALKTMKSGLVFLVAKQEERCHLIIRISDDLVAKGLHAGNLIKTLASLVQGKGGGKANQAQASGQAPENTQKALQMLETLI